MNLHNQVPTKTTESVVLWRRLLGHMVAMWSEKCNKTDLHVHKWFPFRLFRLLNQFLYGA